MNRPIRPFALCLGSLWLALAGCGGDAPKSPARVTDSPPPVAHDDADGHEHSHPTEGPHHGHLIELGKEEYHAELTHDDEAEKVTVYLLDKLAVSPVTSAEAEIALNLVVDNKPLQAKLAAEPQAGDAEGQSSRFSLVDKAVVEALEAPTSTGRLTVTIGGKSFSGKVVHQEHGDHKH